ncbi:APEH enzyme, partial [Chroicocephalus maculipennis]|nr:APEH enzyme [Chroicocephalus maculipennis]
LLSQESPSGALKAVLRKVPGKEKKEEKQFLEVWDQNCEVKSIDLTPPGKHGTIYDDGPFACLAWSHSETRLLYVAEKSRPKPRPPCPWDVPGAGRPEEEDEEVGAMCPVSTPLVLQEEQFVYREDWGEALSTRSLPVLCVLDLEGSSLSVLEGIPEHLSPGQVRMGCRESSGGGTTAWGCGTSLPVAQALWSPNDCGVVFVGWWHEPFRLGLNACSNRRWVPPPSIPRQLLSSEHGAVCSPRLSPDGRRLLYLEGGLGGPHRQCLRLRMVSGALRAPATAVSPCAAGPSATLAAFAGLYTEVLPPRCWAADSRRAVLGTPQRSRTCLSAHLRAPVYSLSPGSPEGCWELLTLQWDLLVATCSAPHHPPSLMVAALPPAGQELPLCWVPVEDTPTVPGVTWTTLTIQPPCSRQSPATHGEDTLAALVAAWVTFLLAPGGPHAVFDARWRPSMAALCQLGFAVLLVNYRGSLGFGQASISSLLSRVGEQDVADTQLAVEQALCSEPLDPHRLALLAGSHGAFIALHLLAREPKRYRACALRSPVSNLPALLGTSDIPDWGRMGAGCSVLDTGHPPSAVPQVQTPVLLCVGARDRRVSPTQALELYRVLQARGVPVRLLWYPEGGHALAGVETAADVFGNCARWLLRHLVQ